MTDHRGLQFIDAVKELAQAAGLDMPAQDPRAAETDAKRQKLLDVMGRAAAFYSAEFRQFGSDAAQDHLSARGIGPGDAALFDLGWAPSSRRGEPSRLRAELRDVADDVLLELGLLKRPDDGREPYDFFRARITIPIHDARGRVIGFGARAIGDAQPKYLNSPDTPLFDKGRTLFNLHRASGPAQRKGRLVVVEGYLDVMAMHRAGIEEVVAPNGTAITETQLRMLWRLSPAPILCLDGDAAGRKAAVRAAMLALPLIEPGKTLQFVFPPAGSDPDDLERTEGAAAVSHLLAEPRSLISVIWEHELNAHGSLGNPDTRGRLLVRVEQIVAMIKSHGLALEYQGEFMRLLRAATSRQTARPRIQPSDAGLAATIEAAVVVGLIRNASVLIADVEGIAAIRWRMPAHQEIVGALVDAAIASNLATDAVWAALERAGVADIARDAERAALRLNFSFLTPGTGTAGQADLAEAIGRMQNR